MVEHHLANVGVAGSNPVFRSIFIKRLCRFIFLKAVKTTYREVAQLGRALGLGPRGRRFESCLPDFYNAGMAELADALESGSSVFGRGGSSPLTRIIFIIIYLLHGGLAQLGERLPCTQEVSGSIPLVSTFFISYIRRAYSSAG